MDGCMVFIWDQPTIWDRRLIPLINFLSKIRDENVTNFASFSVNSLASYSSASEVVAAEETIQPTSTRSKLLISAVTHSVIHLFRHRLDHFVGHSLLV